MAERELLLQQTCLHSTQPAQHPALLCGALLCSSSQAAILAVGGSSQKVVLEGGKPVTKTIMTVTISGEDPPVSCWPGHCTSGCGSLAARLDALLAVWASHCPPVCLSWLAGDHRIYDGELAGAFLAAFTKNIEAPHLLVM